MKIFFFNLLFMFITILSIQCNSFERKQSSNLNNKNQANSDSLNFINNEITLFLSKNKNIPNKKIDSLIEIVNGLVQQNDSNFHYNMNLTLLYSLKKDTINYVHTLRKLYKITENPTYSIQLGLLFKNLNNPDSSIKYINLSKDAINKRLNENVDKSSNLYISDLTNLITIYCIDSKNELADTVVKYMYNHYDTSDLMINTILKTYKSEGCKANIFGNYTW